MGVVHRSNFDHFPIPVSFRCLEIGSETFEYATEVISIFNEGFVMSSPRTLRVGTLLVLRLRVPTELPGSPFHEIHCKGCVTSEQRLKDGKLGYKVEIKTALLA